MIFCSTGGNKFGKNYVRIFVTYKKNIFQLLLLTSEVLCEWTVIHLSVIYNNNLWGLVLCFFVPSVFVSCYKKIKPYWEPDMMNYFMNQSPLRNHYLISPLPVKFNFLNFFVNLLCQSLAFVSRTDINIVRPTITW